MIANYVLRMLSEDIDNVPLFKGVNGLLNALSNREVTLAILSTNSFANISTVLGAKNMVLIKFLTNCY